jgi:pimeloyl-ACP methyl ester carboxylesterase
MAAGYVDTDGVRLWYEELGRPDGAPLLLVMGGGASVVWWPPELLQGLVGAGYRVVQFDNRDTGLSSYVDWASAPYGIEDMAGDAMGVLDAVDSTPPTLSASRWAEWSPRPLPWGIPIACAP